MSDPVYIHWFRQDLRLADNPSLSAVAANGSVLPVYILDDANAGDHRMGGASRWWLHHSLTALNQALDGKLVVLSGNPAEILANLADAVAAAGLSWNRAFDPWRITRDAAIKAQFAARGRVVESHNGSLLWEPWDVLKNDGTPYKVFTPYYRRGCLAATPPRRPLPMPLNLVIADGDGFARLAKAANLAMTRQRRIGDELFTTWRVRPKAR